jgi:hypothetical protein
MSPAMRSDDARTIVVVAERPQLPAAVRERVSAEVALVRWTDHQRLPQTWGRCHPWPWIVIGSGSVPAGLAELLDQRPVVVAWLGDPSPSPGPDWIPLEGWAELTAWLGRLRRVRVGGLGLAPYRGVATTGDRIVRAPAVEALLAAHPRGLAPSPAMRGARTLLTRSSLPCEVRKRGDLLRLEAAGPRNGGDRT